MALRILAEVIEQNLLGLIAYGSADPGTLPLQNSSNVGAPGSRRP